ncbi:MAG: hypothetical protein ABJE99_06125 [Roseobacter sp.]|uniref:hypothetical protein n=1 Tax=Alphaproteobacteria TaxID=28211 RepID=UPI003265FFAE
MKHPQKGDVWRYDYLWFREHETGQENARKSRPTALVTTFVDKTGRTNLFWVPITSKPPLEGRVAIEIPQIERRRAGLASDLPLWVMADEYNHEFLETSFYIDPNGFCGTFSVPFINKVLDVLIAAGKRGGLDVVKRHDD